MLKRVFPIVALALGALSGAAFADAPDNRLYLGETKTPVYWNDEILVPTAVVTVSGATSKSAVGEVLADAQESRALGSFITDFPIDESEIDWPKTLESVPKDVITAFPTAEDPTKRLLLSAGGEGKITWISKKGDSYSVSYTITGSATKRPYRLFATRYGEANNAAFISLSGKFVEFYGAEDVIGNQEYLDGDKTKDVIYGFDYQKNTQMLTARYRVTDEKTGAIKCPSGQFVLVYFSTDRKDQPIAAIPVEIVPPNVRSLNVAVGEELRPEGGGWDVDDLKAIVKKGLSKEADDLYAPYLEQFSAPTGLELGNPDHGKIYAIAPTDMTTSRTGEPEPWKADVFWTTTDQMGTRWTFENDWYLISWPENAINVVVSGVVDQPGMPWIVSTNYVTTVKDYHEPKDLRVTTDPATGQVNVSGAGKLLLKLSTKEADKVWYLAANAARAADETVHTRDPIPTVIGREITPRYGVDAGTAAAAASRVDARIPGYISDYASIGKNWNPRLYHAPSTNALNLDFSSVDTLTNSVNSADAYSKLVSAIYPVSDNGLIHVWWSGSVDTLSGKKLPIALTYPALIQEYQPSWERTMAEGVLPEIAIASFSGSNDKTITANDGFSITFKRNESKMAISPKLTVPKTEGEEYFNLALYPELSSELFANGRLLTLKSGVNEITVDVTRYSDKDVTLFVRSGNKDLAQVVLIPGQWGMLAVKLTDVFEVGAQFTAIFGSADGKSAVQGLAIGGVQLGNERPTVAFYFKENNFTDGDDVRDFQCVADVGDGYKLKTSLCSYKDFGAPNPCDGLIYELGGVKPELYYENVRKAVGYNPNEEHAFLTDDGEGKYTAWALRCDLNVTNGVNKSSHPVVFVMHAAESRDVNDNTVLKGAMKAFRVVTTNAAHPSFEHQVLAGERIYRPGALQQFGGRAANGTKLDTAKSISSGTDSNPVFKDRKNVMWARRDGTALAYYGYRTAKGFAFPSLEDGEPIPEGTEIPWLSCLDAETASETAIKTGTPVAWLTTINWRNPDDIPSLKIAEILTTPTRGLPEMWNAASMAVTYPLTETDSRVTLIDPTIAQTAPLPIEGDFVAEYGFKLGKSGNVMLRKGKYYFTNLPPSISDRFYVDANADESQRMVLVGDRVESASGGSYLRLNVLSDAERAALKAICVEGAPQKAEWDKAVAALATSEVRPSGVKDGEDTTGQKKELSVDYVFPTEAAYEEWKKRVGENKTWIVSVTVNNFDSTTTANSSYTYVHTGLEPTPEEVGGNYVTRKATWDAAKANVKTVRLTKGSFGEVPYKRAYVKMLEPQLASAGWEDLAWDQATAKELPIYEAVRVRGRFTWEGGRDLPASAYAPHVNYGLIGNGDGTGYVTLIENDNADTTEVKESLPVSMHLIKVIPELNTDGIAVIRDALNKLSERQTLLYRTPLGDAAKDFEFEWRYATPDANGRLPENKDEWQTRGVQAGLVALQLGDGQNLQDYVNTYYTLRYRPRPGTAVFGVIAKAMNTDNPEKLWSAWAPEQLAEGWLQRVLNAVTPFAQRVEDFYDNPSDAAFTMLEQIGGPYQGDVALNNENLKEVGLLELYQTLLNRAENIYNSLGGSDPEMSKQLLLAVTRLGEFYSLLGAEAYADAKNPLIPVGDGTLASTSVFAFQNQEPSLLDEELALLRGRTSDRPYPRMGDAPLFNRLAWNLTKGITEGEVAYVANYGIRAENGVLDVNCAAKQYPQGHGDAYGHFLSGVKTYYHLLENTNFVWRASKEMLMDQTVTSVDYDEIEKFATLAHRLAETGRETMELTARRAWRETDGNPRKMREDADTNQAFGYGEWAARTGMGAVYNWMAAGTVSPTNRTGKISGISRLSEDMRKLEEKLVSIEAGRNPLGLDENAIPFDIDPDRLAEKNSHFEQILERAEIALRNTETVIDRANRFGNRLAQIQKTEESTLEEIDKTERDFNNRLIAVFGTPYPGDIGAGGTYPQGYDGPDLYNYNYMDVKLYGISTEVALTTKFTAQYAIYKANGLGTPSVMEQKIPVFYDVNEGGIRIKPESITGVRATEGSVQTAYRNFLVAYGEATAAVGGYTVAVEGMKAAHAKLAEKMAQETTTFGLTVVKFGLGIWDPGSKLGDKIDAATAEMKSFTELNAAQIAVAPQVSVGLLSSTTTSPTGIMLAEKLDCMQSVTETRVAALAEAKEKVEILVKIPELLQNALDLVWGYSATTRANIAEMQTAVDGVTASVSAIQTALAKLSTAEAAYRQEVYKGQAILEEREAWRKQVSNGATEQRYLDMFNRVQRNNALTQYATSYDSAQRYVWELAKVYDFETGLLSTDPLAGKKFLSEIIATRSLGEEGLNGVVDKMKANWGVLKGRLGINNPDVTAKTFSLRYELFRIDQGERGDAAWKQELKKYWTDDINANAEYARHCQPLVTEPGMKEPGLIIPFSTTIDTAKNFFGRSLQGGDHAYSTADYATKIAALGVSFEGYDALTEKGADGLAAHPNVYLVPVGTDYLRAPTEKREVLGYRVVDQVMPLPYVLGSSVLDDENWISTFAGLAGGGETGAKIRRHSTLVADGTTYSTRLVGRSVWNDKWLLVIPAASLNANREVGLERFIEGVSDIKVGIRAYSRAGN